MLRAIRDFFEEHINPDAAADTPQDPEHKLHLATAALLVEITRADHTVRPEERQAVQAGVRTLFGLSPDETTALVSLAEQAAAEATDLYQFTQLINEHFSAGEKFRVVEMLWQVAFSDDHKDAHEEHLIRRIADMLHVSHGDFIRARLGAEQAERGAG